MTEARTLDRQLPAWVVGAAIVVAIIAVLGLWVAATEGESRCAAIGGCRDAVVGASPSPSPGPP